MLEDCNILKMKLKMPNWLTEILISKKTFKLNKKDMIGIESEFSVLIFINVLVSLFYIKKQNSPLQWYGP